MSLLSVAAGPPLLQGSEPGALPINDKQIAAYRASQQAPPISAPAALLVDSDTQKVMVALEPTTSRPMASLTKIMTALLTLERAGLEETVVVSPTALIGESSMGLTAGEVLTVEDLLWGLLLNSGNDAAVALAEHVSGSEEAFVDLMNQRAAELGLTGTQFANSHGLDASGHYSSADDLWRLSEAAMAYPIFREIVSTQVHTAAGHPLWNRNELLSLVPGADGVKTGTTDLAGQCLVGSVTRDGHRTLGVVLGSADRYGDFTALLDHHDRFYEWMPAPQLQGTAAWMRSEDGRLLRVAAPDAPDLYLPAWQRWALRAQAVAGTAPGDPGTVRWFLGPTLLAESAATHTEY